MNSHSKTTAAFFLALLLILGSWPDNVHARFLLSNVYAADLASSTSLSSESLKGLRATNMEPLKKVKTSFRRIPPTRSNPTQN
uniref:Tyrosine recombinase n=1 Tax=Tanacetum cinerariifolium TaxID=118510 RepID=A0A6L2NR72_TANCI|nr:tyrosine recombinase [Tanacetum cinerariifolium]